MWVAAGRTSCPPGCVDGSADGRPPVAWVAHGRDVDRPDVGRRDDDVRYLLDGGDRFVLKQLDGRINRVAANLDDLLSDEVLDATRLHQALGFGAQDGCNHLDLAALVRLLDGLRRA